MNKLIIKYYKYNGQITFSSQLITDRLLAGNYQRFILPISQVKGSNENLNDLLSKLASHKFKDKSIAKIQLVKSSAKDTREWSNTSVWG